MSDPKLPFGSKYCKCPRCGQYFTSDYTFSMHLAGEPTARKCMDPARVLDKQRRPRLRLNDKGYWASNRVRARHWEA